MRDIQHQKDCSSHQTEGRIFKTGQIDSPSGLLAG
jgi:hypothetical protein